MATHEERLADELDAYLTQRQSGNPAPRPATMSADEAAFLEDLLALAEAHRPDPAFAGELEDLLRERMRRRPSGTLRRMIAGDSETGAPMNKKLYSYLAGALALVIIIGVGFIALSRAGVLAGPEVAVQTPVEASPTAAEEPSGAVSVTATAPEAAIQTPAEASPTPTEEQPTEWPVATPPPWPEEPPLLPSLAMLMGGGYGGGGPSAYVPPEVTLVLGAALPEGPERATVYAQVPEVLTLAHIEEEAARWGLDGRVDAPHPAPEMESTGEFARLYGSVVDLPQQLSFLGTEVLIYTDDSAFRHPSVGHWYPWGSPPPEEQGIATAEQFLRERGLLQEPYEVAAGYYRWSGGILFYRILDSGETLVGPFAYVTISPDGRVAQVTYQPFDLDSLGDYPIISAQEAWDMVVAGAPAERLWVNIPTTALAADPRLANPRFWMRTYQAGERVDLAGPVGVLEFADGEAPYVLVDGVVLTGDNLQALVEDYEGVRDASLDTEAPMHVWGQVQDADGYQVMQVEGWETLTVDSQQGWMTGPGAPYLWTGTIRREDDQGVLVTSPLMIAGGGRTLQMPDLPSDLDDGTEVYVEGILLGDTLSWRRIQEHAADEGAVPPPPPAAVQATVEQVALIYYASPLEHLAQESLYANFGTRSVQPVWRFRGHTDQGAAFEIYVQAVADNYLLGE